MCRKLLLLGAAIISLAALTACNQNPSNQPSPSPTPSPSTMVQS